MFLNSSCFSHRKYHVCIIQCVPVEKKAPCISDMGPRLFGLYPWTIHIHQLISIYINQYLYLYRYQSISINYFQWILIYLSMVVNIYNTGFPKIPTSLLLLVGSRPAPRIGMLLYPPEYRSDHILYNSIVLGRVILKVGFK